MNDQEKALLSARALSALRDRVAAETYMTVTDVCKRLNYSRKVVTSLPPELLPFVPFGTGAQIHRRYHPADVLAADARLRAWERAKQKGAAEGEAYLARLRAELDEMDAAAIAAAAEMRRAGCRPPIFRAR